MHANHSYILIYRKFNCNLLHFWKILLSNIVLYRLSKKLHRTYSINNYTYIHIKPFKRSVEFCVHCDSDVCQKLGWKGLMTCLTKCQISSWLSSAESQKGVIAVQSCCTKSRAIAPFWLSTEYLWSAITPFWLSTDDILNQIGWGFRKNADNIVPYTLKHI